MDTLLTFIQANAEYAHWIIFGALLLAGFNIPVSEDAMLFISALLAKNSPEHLPQLFLGVYMGAFISDLICYSIGRYLGPKMAHTKFFSNWVPDERINKIHAYYERYGIATLIIGRFIPFGVRNGLFLTAGLGQMSFVKFFFSDLFACTLSSVTFFYIYYHYGHAVIDAVKQANTVLFVIVIFAVLAFYLQSRKRKE